MASGNIEIEIKFPVSKLQFDKVLKCLKRDSQFKDSNISEDVYYNSPGRNFLAKKHPTEYLRLRITGKSGLLTYKNVYLNDEGLRTHSDEFESSVSDPAAFVKILTRLDFKNILTVYKQRQSYVYNKTFEVDLDKVRGLGYFVEIESISSKAGVENTRTKIKNLAVELGLDPEKQDKKGYVIALMEKKKLL